MPSIHPHAISQYNVLRSILSHGFMSSSILPNRLDFPVIASTLLGSNVVISDEIIVDSFTDHVSNFEGSVFREALVIAESQFSPQLEAGLLNMLSTRDCREIPTPANIICFK